MHVLATASVEQEKCCRLICIGLPYLLLIKQIGGSPDFSMAQNRTSGDYITLHNALRSIAGKL